MSKPSAVRLGQRFGSVVVVELHMGGPKGRRAVVKCDCGGRVMMEARKLPRSKHPTCGQCSGKAKRPTDGAPGYVGAHHRVERARGKAREHACEGCGGPATQWALDLYHAAGQPFLFEETGPNAGTPYSLNPDHYWPACAGCHRRYDRSIMPDLRTVLGAA